jgi:hypothetical protein
MFYRVESEGLEHVPAEIEERQEVPPSTGRRQWKLAWRRKLGAVDFLVGAVIGASRISILPVG